jgi:hypothetical protein
VVLLHARPFVDDITDRKSTQEALQNVRIELARLQAMQQF